MHSFTLNFQLPPPHLLRPFLQPHSNSSPFLQKSTPTLPWYSPHRLVSAIPSSLPSLASLSFSSCLPKADILSGLCPWLLSYSLTSSLRVEATQITRGFYLLPKLSSKYQSCRLNILIQLCCEDIKFNLFEVWILGGLSAYWNHTCIVRPSRKLSHPKIFLIPVSTKPPKHFVQSSCRW